MKFFALKNLSSNEAAPCDPTTAKPVASYPGSKEKFREWCADSKTKHVFYSAVEGLNPHQRVTVENPPKLLHGLVIDYDAIVSEKDIALLPFNGVDGLLPMWSTMTYSGKRRLIWEFEQPVLCDHEELTQRFLKQLAKTGKFKNLLPALDENSYKLTQYFELGRDWRRIPEGRPVSANTLGTAFFKAAEQKPIIGKYSIPLEKVAEEVERRWPGRWNGEFEEGRRGPLFWVEPFVDRVGASVGEFGMLCYSDRAESQFMSWGKIFGHEFIRKYEEEKIGSVTTEWWYVGQEKCYVQEHDGKLSLPYNYTQVQRHFADLGLEPRLLKGETISEVNKAITIVERSKMVHSAAPFPFNPEKRVWIRGKSYLNTTTVKAVEPAANDDPNNWPFISEYINKIWSPDEPIQKKVFTYWHKRFYETCLENAPELGQAIFFSGPAGIGKTFLSHRIVGDSVGEHIDAAKFLLNKTSFNEEAGTSVLWAVDDEVGSKTWEEHTQMSAALKKYVATPEFRMEAKFKDAFTREFYGRIFVTCNDTPESLSILPIIDESVDDKLIFLHSGTWRPPFLPRRRDNNARVRRELPYYLRWLLNLPPNPQIEDAATRYGIIPWKHPLMLRTAQQSSQSTQLAELLAIWVTKRINDKKETEGWFTASEVMGEMQGIPELRNQLRSFAANRMGKALTQLWREKSPWIKAEPRPLNGYNEYLIALKRPT